jgi:hypothetical protein
MPCNWNSRHAKSRNAEMRKTPFGVGSGHGQWSRERKKLVELNSILEFRRSQHEESRPFITGVPKL